MAAESPATAPDQRPPRVFLSYSHDSPEHAARVLALARQFRRDGVDARIDQFDAFPPEGWPQWCARQILDARFVVLICTETYRRRFLGYEEAGTGRGVKWEGNIVQNILYNKERNMRFIPAVFAKEDEQFIPETVQGATRVLLGDFGAGDGGYATLVRHFSGDRKFPPLPDLVPANGGSPPDDASIPTRNVWNEAERIFVELAEQEKNARVRHRVIVAALGLLAIAAVGGGIWIARSHTEGVAKVEAIVADPAVLRAKLEEKIDVTFEQKRGELLAAKAPPAEIDALYRWRDRAKGQVAEAVVFITARAGDVNSPIIKKAAATLQERGPDAALEFLDATLKAERQRRKEEGRQFAEASMMKAGLHESRFETAEQERAIRDAIADAPEWWEPRNALGMLLHIRAQRELAEQEYQAARKTMPPEAEGTLLTNLAQLYLDTNRLAQAEPLMERALQIDEARSGPEHPDVARDLNNLALLYQSTNRLAQAEPLVERALRIDEKTFGPAHPNVARDLNNLAQLYLAMYRVAEAEPVMKRVTSILEKNHGPEHPNVASSLSNLAQLYQATDRMAEAEPLMERALKIDEKSFGPEHPKVAASLHNLATLYQATDRVEKAEPLLKRVTAVFEKSYGVDHPNVASSLNNLAQLYQATNRLAEAEPLMERALKIDEQSFGREHPAVARDLINLGRLYQATNRMTEAEPLMERALKIDEKSSNGPEHPNVARDLFELAQLYQATNRMTEAEPRLRRAVVILLKSTRASGYPLPNLKLFLASYKGLLDDLSIPAAGIAERVAAAGRDAGYTPEEFAELRKKLGE